MDEAPEKTRLDKWLWFARFCKTRGLASETVRKGRVRVNGARVTKAGARVRENDIIVIRMESTFRSVRVLKAGERRGPAAQARELYEELG